MKTKILVLFLAALLMLSLLAGCKSKAPATETDEPTDTDATGEPYYPDTLPRSDYAEFDKIKIATIDSNIMPEEMPDNADMVDEQKYWRDYQLQKNWNMTISYHEVKNGIDSEEAMYMLNLVQQNSSEVDAFIQQPDNLMTLAINGAVCNLYGVKTLDLSREWWSQSMNQNLVFNDSLYVTAGPVAEWYYGAVLAMAYNKTLAEAEGIPSLYDTVLAGEWTLEAMQTIITEHNLTDKPEGKYAISFASGVGPYGLFASAGGHFAAIDEDKGIVVDLASTSNVQLLEAILKAFDRDQTIYGNIKVTSDAFIGAKTLFYYTTVGYMELYLPSSGIDYGIIPCPKYDVKQEKYISCAWPSSSYAMAIPSYEQGRQLEWVGLVMEAYCYKGMEMIKPVKYDTLLKYQVALDNVSSMNLDLIFDNVYFDINLVSNLGGSRSFIGTAITQGMGGYAGSYIGISGLIKADIAKFSSLTGKS